MSEPSNTPVETNSTSEEHPTSPEGFEQSASGVDEVFSMESESIERLRTELKEAQERELRAQAELENFRKRITREYDSLLKFASMGLVRDLLEVMDNLNRACAAADGQSKVETLLEGVRMVQQQMINVLSKYECKPIDSVGKEFDPNFHQAIAQMPSPDHAAGLVMHEASVGYLMHDRVIRPSQVIVSTGS